MKHNNLWAPWRIEYLRELGEAERKESQGVNRHGQVDSGCFLCDNWNNPDKDKESLVLYRTKMAMVVMNHFPYTGGHLLISPAVHVPDLDLLDEPTMLEMMRLGRDTQKVLAETIHPHGFNVGINIGRCSGAGLPGHVHMHVVPRWDGDTNFMAVTGHVRVISQSLEELYEELLDTAGKLGLLQ